MTNITEEMITRVADLIDPTHEFTSTKKAAREMLEAALAGYTVNRLPEPDKRQDECGVTAATWYLREVTAAFRPPNIMSYAIDGEPCVYDGPGPEHTYTVAEMRERCLAGLAACEDAERLASESSGGETP